MAIVVRKINYLGKFSHRLHQVSDVEFFSPSFRGVTKSNQKTLASDLAALYLMKAIKLAH